MQRKLKSIALAFLLLLVGTASTSGMELARFYLPAGTLTIPGEAPLFEIFTALDAADPHARRLTQDDFRCVEKNVHDGGVTLEFSCPPDEWGGEVRVEVSLQDAGREVLARLTVESGSYFPIRLVRFPVMDTPEVNRFDTLLFPHHCGDAIHDPRVMISTRLGGVYSRRYPADVGLQFMTLYNQARNYYIAAYHDGDEFYDWTVRTKGPGLRFSLDWYPFLDDGGSWSSPECSMSVLPGDWHSAADLYAEHMRDVFKPPILPEWMRDDFHGWIQFSMKGGDPTPAYTYPELVDLYRNYVVPNGLNTMHVFSWQEGGFHYFPDFKVSPKCGTARQLREALDEIRAMGGHVDLYTHGSAIDTESDLFRGEGYHSFIKTEFGSPQIRTWSWHPGGRACPYSESFQDHMVRQFERMITEYHAHGAQIDTNACIPAQFCYDKSHGHRTPAAGWLPGEDALLRKIHDTYRALDPDFFVWVEGINERYGQYYEVNQGHGEGQGWTAGESMPEVFQYTYPDFLCTGDSDDIDGLCHTFGQGKAFDIHPGPRLHDPVFTGLLRDFVRVRKQEPEYFLRGRFMDTVGIDVAGDAVKYWRIDRRDGRGMLVNLWARGSVVGQDCTAYIRMPQNARSIRAVYPDDLQLIESGRWWQVNWKAPVATVVFEMGDN